VSIWRRISAIICLSCSPIYLTRRERRWARNRRVIGYVVFVLTTFHGWLVYIFLFVCFLWRAKVRSCNLMLYSIRHVIPEFVNPKEELFESPFNSISTVPYYSLFCTRWSITVIVVQYAFARVVSIHTFKHTYLNTVLY
jgi:hypothetical protein